MGDKGFPQLPRIGQSHVATDMHLYYWTGTIWKDLGGMTSLSLGINKNLYWGEDGKLNAADQVQSDWNETNRKSPAFIQNIPKGLAYVKDINFDVLCINKSVGEGDEQVAVGSHNHAVTVTQAGHNFVVGNAIKPSPTGWVKAQANSSINAGTVGIVSEIIDTSHFKYLPGGKLKGSFVPAAQYYLSATTAGLIFAEPDNYQWEMGTVCEYIGTANEDGTALIVEIDAGFIITEFEDRYVTGVSFNTLTRELNLTRSAGLPVLKQVIPLGSIWDFEGISNAGWSEGKVLKFDALGNLVVGVDLQGTGGSGISLSDLSAVSPLSYDSSLGKFSVASGYTIPTTLEKGRYDTAYSWGNHLGLYRPISYVPTWLEVTGKPVFHAVATSGSYLDLINLPALKPVATSGSYNDLTEKPFIPSLVGYATQLWVDSTYLKSFTETDPVFTAWNKSSGITITTSQISDWSVATSTFVTGTPWTAMGYLTDAPANGNMYARKNGIWEIVATGSGADGNNYTSGLTFSSATGVLTLNRTGLTDLTTSLDGRYLTGVSKAQVEAALTGQISTHSHNYLSSFTETDPVFTAWNKSTGISITSSQISNWITATSSFVTGSPWTLCGYLTTLPAHTLDSHSNVSITLNTAGELLKWDGLNWVNSTLAEAGIQPAGSYLTGITKPMVEAVLTGKILSHTHDYLSFFTETDPIFSAWNKSTGISITASQISNWAAATSSFLTALPAHTLDGHSNVSITSNTSGEILKWDGLSWVNNTLAEAGIQPAGSYLTGITKGMVEGVLTGTISSHSHAGAATPNAATFNNSGLGALSGTTFDGSAARTISYNTVGAAALAGSVSQDFSTAHLTVTNGMAVDSVGLTIGDKRITLNGSTFYFGNTNGSLNMTFDTSTGTLYAPVISGLGGYATQNWVTNNFTSFPGFYSSGGNYGTGGYAARYDHTHDMTGYATQNWVSLNYTSFPGFGTTHTTAAYGDHTHDYSGTYAAKSSEGAVALDGMGGLFYLSSSVLSMVGGQHIVTVDSPNPFDRSPFSAKGAQLMLNGIVQFPGFGTDHYTAAYGDHNHDSVYALAGHTHGSSGISDAPSDGNYYARRSAAWSKVNALDTAANASVYNLPNGWSMSVSGSTWTLSSGSGASISCNAGGTIDIYPGGGVVNVHGQVNANAFYKN